MTLFTWILLIFGLLMYIEGLAVAGAVGLASKPSKLLWPFLLLLWPIIIPMLAYKAYIKYAPIIQQLQQLQQMTQHIAQPNPLQQNPLMEIVSFGSPAQPSPVAAILNQSKEPTKDENEGE